MCLTDQFTDEESISCTDKECEALGCVENQGSYINETTSAFLTSLNILCS